MEQDNQELFHRHQTHSLIDQTKRPFSPLDESQELLTPSSAHYQELDKGSNTPTTRSPKQEIPRKSVTSLTTPSNGRAWRTGVFQNVPWMGLSSLLIALLSIIASATVLVASNKVAVASWSVSPHVILAVLSVIITSCLKISLASGLTVSWWHHVLNAAPLADTHRYWDFGNNVWAAVTAGKHFNFISLATILVTLAMIEGPLVQKASTVSTRRNSKPMSILASLAPNLPQGYTASATGEFRTPTVPSSEFSDAFREYSTRSPIIEGFQGCPGTCNLTIPGVGFEVDCQTFNTSYSMENYGTVSGNYKAQFMANTTWTGAFGCPGGCNESLTLNTGYAINTEPLAFVNRACSLSLAIVSYPLSLVNNSVTFLLPPGTNPDVLSPLPAARTPSTPGIIDMRTTLGGFYLLGGYNAGLDYTNGPFYANVTMATNGALGLYTLSGLNAFSWSHSVSSNWDVMQYEGYEWQDPANDILAAYHEIMFRLALKAATNATLVAPIVINGTTYSSVKNVSATYHFDENYYTSNFSYLAGALAVIVIAILAVLPTFRGWWHIGRPTTLSPLETAKAFGAPLLAECNSNETVQDLISSVENRKVKYGTMRWRGEWDSEITLRLAEVGMVDNVKRGTVLSR